MIRSMTGFASKLITLSFDKDRKANIEMSLKSLNSRFFEATCKLNYQLSALETELTKLLKKKLFRGKIYFTLYTSNQDLFKGAITPSLETINSYAQAIDQAKKTCKLEGQLSVSDLIRLPNVFAVEEKEIDTTTKKQIFDAADQLITTLIAEQEKEGIELKNDMEKRIAIMRTEIDAIEQASGKLIEVQKAKVEQALQDIQGDENTLAEIQKHAAYTLLDKMDINEEIVRFKSHIKNLDDQLTSETVEKGKRLDFTLQELAREINTIAAKCSDATISSRAITIKVELEKTREQAQNIV